MRDCLARVRRHDEEAASDLMHHLYPLVIKIVRSHLPRRMDEQDMAQIVFVKIFTHLDQFSGNVPLEHWVSRIAVNSCLNQLRSEKNKPELRWADLTEEQAAVLDAILSNTQTPAPGVDLGARELVHKMLSSLSPTDRLILNLLDMEQRSIEEIRRMTGWNASLIKVRAFRARHKLRKQFGRLAREDYL